MRLVSTTAEFADVATEFIKKHAAQFFMITNTGFIREKVLIVFFIVAMAVYIISLAASLSYACSASSWSELSQ